eukprot:3488947-Pyramimonas_sp.AAC.1
MATPIAVDALMSVAMMATMAVMTAARPMTAPILIAPADNDDNVLASAMKVLDGVRRPRAADAREWFARCYLTLLFNRFVQTS